jgi:AraC-like DNA-binding protein
MPEATARTCPSPPGGACTNATEPQPKLGKPRGPLLQPAGTETGRFSPSAELAPFVEHYWWVRWELERPEVAAVLSYPSVHVTFEGSDARIIGVVRGKFTRRLEGRGEVFAVKFRPGMFRPWYGAPAIRLTNRVEPLGKQLGAPASDLMRAIFATDDELTRAKVLETCLRGSTPPHDADAELARDLVERVRSDASMNSVAQLSAAAGLTLRTVQRLFRDYVGVGPKWVVCRFRLQEAAELLETTEETVGSVAASLGYFDQAHFVRDFKTVVGKTPSEYVREARARRTR